mmetsp:Transcript_25360/g.85007  ORF Transcript_25360/g.85007 Transcript_25360/m.85007 type:complete len:237 (-) Transcript_25360:216-926(-)
MVPKRSAMGTHGHTGRSHSRHIVTWPAGRRRRGGARRGEAAAGGIPFPGSLRITVSHSAESRHAARHRFRSAQSKLAWKPHSADPTATSVAASLATATAASPVASLGAPSMAPASACGVSAGASARTHAGAGMGGPRLLARAKPLEPSGPEAWRMTPCPTSPCVRMRLPSAWRTVGASLGAADTSSARWQAMCWRERELYTSANEQRSPRLSCAPPATSEAWKKDAARAPSRRIKP